MFYIYIICNTCYIVDAVRSFEIEIVFITSPLDVYGELFVVVAVAVTLCVRPTAGFVFIAFGKGSVAARYS